MSTRKFLSILLLSAVTTGAHAELKAMDDAAMSEVTGQAFVSIDRQYHPSVDNSTSYTRINLGMDIEIQSNADVLELGRYERDDSATGGENEKAGTSDVLVKNFGLGYIQNSDYYSDHPDAPRMLKPNGQPYSEGEIVPFQIKDPFIEFAYDEDSNEVVGVRIGYGEAKGILSGNIETLTGNVNVDIIDHGEGLSNADSDGNLFDQLIVLLTPLLEGSSPLSTKAKLVKGDDNDPDVGSLDPVRAEHIGIPDGEKFTLEGASAFTRWSVKNLIGWGSSSEIEVPNCSLFNCPGGDIYVYAKDCRVLGIDSCFDLDIYESFPIGEVEEINGDRYITDPKKGMFLSFQTKDLDWLGDVEKENPVAADFIRATAGGFFNVPNGATEVNLNEALNGVQRYRSEYIDRGKGLF
ncbi:hypothetical protein QQM79_20795 [Marinobacteraceae bacterium S3BR75-40.1]